MSCHAFGSTPVADAQSLAQSLAADTLEFVHSAPMHAVIKSPVRGTHIGLALSISAIPDMQLTHRNHQAVRYCFKTSTEIDLQRRGIQPVHGRPEAANFHDAHLEG